MSTAVPSISPEALGLDVASVLNDLATEVMRRDRDPHDAQALAAVACSIRTMATFGAIDTRVGFGERPLRALTLAAGDEAIELLRMVAAERADVHGARAVVDAAYGVWSRFKAERADRFGIGASDVRATPLSLSRPLASIDIEATGPNEDSDRIIELGIVILCDAGWRRSEYRWLVNPCRPIPPTTTEIHGFTDAHVQGKPTFSDIAQQVASVLKGCDLLGYNIRGMDLGMLRNEFRRSSVEWPCEGAHVIDPFHIFRERSKRDLTTAVQVFCGREHKGAHGAIADAHATLDVLNGQLWRYPDLPRTVEALDTASGGRQPDWATPCGKLKWDTAGDVYIAFGRNAGLRLIDAEYSLLGWLASRHFLSVEARTLAYDVRHGARPRAPWAAPLPDNERRSRFRDPDNEMDDISAEPIDGDIPDEPPDMESERPDPEAADDLARQREEEQQRLQHEALVTHVREFLHESPDVARVEVEARYTEEPDRENPGFQVGTVEHRAAVVFTSGVVWYDGQLSSPTTADACATYVTLLDENGPTDKLRGIERFEERLEEFEGAIPTGTTILITPTAEETCRGSNTPGGIDDDIPF